ncbi:ParA family protein [Geitlerinema sp. PCC 9228]|jgi:chromosome partitioning protein|uniref:ParA family protein n=1 Tax=Geitlerinema sp. PCC 9228 TaxID=111611 RepID=UPI0008F9D6EC|nr:ParA family protein [Geitlerinema sp. PCC 9228]
MGYVIATANMKGGVGKTTLTVNLAAALAKDFGKRVLVVDLDNQISATLSLVPPSDFAKIRREKRTLRYLINQAIQNADQPDARIQDFIRPYVGNTKDLNLLPGDLDLYDEFLVSQKLHEKAVQQQANTNFEGVWTELERVLVWSILEPVIDDFDFIILDCAPGYTLLTRSALACSNFYLLPARPEPLSLIGIQLLQRRLKQLKEVHQFDHEYVMELVGIAFTMSGGLLSGRYSKKVMQRVHSDFGEKKIFQTQIPLDVNVSKAVDSYLPVVISDPTCSGSKAFRKVAKEFMEKLTEILGSKAQKSKVDLVEME